MLRDSIGQCSIVEITSFGEATERLNSEQFFAAIFDIDAPDLCGPIHLQNLRHDCPQLIIAVLSRIANERAVLSYLAVGVSGYILESSSQSEIEHALEVVLSRNIYVPPTMLVDHPERALMITSAPRNFRGLTGRQDAVLRLLLNGCSNKEIARALDLSPHTVKIHVGALLRHFSVKKRTELLATAPETALVNGFATCRGGQRYAPHPAI